MRFTQEEISHFEAYDEYYRRAVDSGYIGQTHEVIAKELIKMGLDELNSARVVESYHNYKKYSGYGSRRLKKIVFAVVVIIVIASKIIYLIKRYG